MIYFEIDDLGEDIETGEPCPALATLDIPVDIPDEEACEVFARILSIPRERIRVVPEDYFYENMDDEEVPS